MSSEIVRLPQHLHSASFMESFRRSYIHTQNYPERVYAGILGKIIGVYLGRPFEGWSHSRIEAELGEIQYYVNDKLAHPIVVTDDDISGTFIFIRALSENGNRSDITAEQIGDWWLNAIIEQKSILWWGGMGLSTENTAYLRLKSGIKAPHSGSIATNGRVVAEQIGAQIFIDSWGMVCPGDPERAVVLAGKAASVSHDGEAKYGAQVIASLVAQAFVESNLERMLDTAAALIPRDSTIYRLIGDVREVATTNGHDWRATLRFIQANYGYDKFPGTCHMVPNHALVLMGLLHGGDDFQRALMIINTAGWDTDCNSANVGCILGIKNGLAGIDAGPDWRGPVADRLFLPCADGAGCITDAVRETYALVNIGRALLGESPVVPKDGARFHFSLPGSVQGFCADNTPESRGCLTVQSGNGKLALRLQHLAPGRIARVGTPTFLTPEDCKLKGYTLIASPTLYSQQIIRACVQVNELTNTIQVRLYLRAHASENQTTLFSGEKKQLHSGESCVLEFCAPDSLGQPFYEVGLEIFADQSAAGTLYLDSLTWDGTPTVRLRQPEGGGNAWERAWVRSFRHFYCDWPSKEYPYRIIQDEGIGVGFQGEWSWSNYTVSTRVLPHMVQQVGLIVAARGLRRYIALILDSDQKIRLVVQQDAQRIVLAEFDNSWEQEQVHDLQLTLWRGRVMAIVNGKSRQVESRDLPQQGAIGLLVAEGHAEFSEVYVRPADNATEDRNAS